MILDKNFFKKNHFSQPETKIEKEISIKHSVSNVVIEIFSYCNRLCSYCPVSKVDRRSHNKFYRTKFLSQSSEI